MNARVILRLLGIISFVIAGAMGAALLWSIYGHLRHGETDARGILMAMGVSFAIGLVLFLAGRSPTGDALRREGIVVVGLAWLLAAALGALPYVFTGTMPTYIDAYFESMSGFTTTGSSVLLGEAIDTLPHGIQFWRHFTQWLGGMGIVVLFVAIIPFLRASGKQLFLTETPGPMSETLQPRVRDTALALWSIYSAISAVLAGLLMAEGMTFFEAICHTCTTMSTGGFSTTGASVAGFDSLAIEVTIIAFMIIAGVNFGIYYRIARGDWRIVFTDPELRFYLLIIALAIGAIALELDLRTPRDAAGSLRHASFQTVSIMTTTGYATDDFDVWPSFSKSLLVVLMFVGGCAGSTGGGIKVVRILVLIKHALIETEHAFRPQAVRSLRIGSVIVEEETRHTILAFFAIMMGTMVIGTLIMCALGMDEISAMTSVAATLNNIGPGLGTVGPAASFADVPQAGKAFLSLAMVVGRLEVFAILVLLTPGLWRGR